LSAAEAPCTIDNSLDCASAYHEQERAYWKSACVITNYALFASELLHGSRWINRRPELLVCDEGHRLLDYLTEAEAVEIDCTLAEKLGLKVGELVSLAQAKGWAKVNIKGIKGRATAEIMAGSKRAGMWMSMLRQVTSVIEADPNLIVTRKGKYFKAVPLWPKSSATAMTESADKILIMSATLYGGEFLAGLLGIDDYYYTSAESPFPTDSWPVYYRPVATMNKRAGAQAWVTMGDECHRYMHDEPESGAIHVASFKQAELIARRILMCAQCRRRLIVQKMGETRNDTLKQFRAQEGAWIVHPSIGEGESFDDELCRVQLIAKIPFPDLGDALVKLRAADSELGQRFYFHSTAAKVVQIVGRGMRHQDDHCRTYILDNSFGMLYDKNRTAFPPWFQRQLR